MALKPDKPLQIFHDTCRLIKRKKDARKSWKGRRYISKGGGFI